MFLPILVGFLATLTAYAPDVTTGALTLFAVLYLLRVLQPLARMQLRYTAGHQPRMDRRWTAVFAAYVFWVILLTVFVSSMGSEFWMRLLFHTLAATTLAIIYSPVYYSGAEYSGNWALWWWREMRVWDFFSIYHGYQPIYQRAAVGGLPTRDEEIRKVRKKKNPGNLELQRLRWEIDEHALLLATAAPERYFTLSLDDYLESLEYPVDERPVLWAAHAHGLSAVSAVWGVALYGSSPLLPRSRETRAAVTDIMFYLPILRELMLLGGCISVSSAAITYNLNRGRSVFLMPGGMLEQSKARRGVREICFERLGFCTLANYHRIPLIPISCTGEEEVYAVYNIFPRIRRYCYKRWGYAFPWIAFGPLPSQLSPVVGRPVLPLSGPHTTREDAWLVTLAQRQRDQGAATLPDLMPLFAEALWKTRNRLKRLQTVERRQKREFPHFFQKREELSRLIDQSIDASSVDPDSFSVILDSSIEQDEGVQQAVYDQVLHYRFYSTLLDLVDVTRAVFGEIIREPPREGESVTVLRKQTHRIRSLARIFGQIDAQ